MIVIYVVVRNYISDRNIERKEKRIMENNDTETPRKVSTKNAKAIIQPTEDIKKSKIGPMLARELQEMEEKSRLEVKPLLLILNQFLFKKLNSTHKKDYFDINFADCKYY